MRGVALRLVVGSADTRAGARHDAEIERGWRGTESHPGPPRGAGIPTSLSCSRTNRPTAAAHGNTGRAVDQATLTATVAAAWSLVQFT